MMPKHEVIWAAEVTMTQPKRLRENRAEIFVNSADFSGIGSIPDPLKDLTTHLAEHGGDLLIRGLVILRNKGHANIV
jgi:hypothetical protein